MADYLNQSPTAWDKQSAAWRKLQGNEPKLLQGYELQNKYDGVSAVFDLEAGTVTSRIGTPLPAAGLILAELQQLAGLPRYLFGELWTPGMSFPQISGLARRQEPAPGLQVRIFDAARDLSGDPRPYSERMREVREVYNCTHDLKLSDPVWPRPGLLGSLEAELDKVHSCRYGEMQLWFDGLVLRDTSAPFVPGKGKDGACIKLKRVDTLDLLVTASHVEERDTKLGGNITVTYNGTLTDVGSGLTQGMLQQIARSPGVFTGRIAEIAHIGVTKDGKLREPRFKGWRTDKDKPD